ncbi:hypothetical protein GYH30_018771 [Glycine max]|nr:hypothetical protein GYH30_018771 [Glycine max]
MAALSSTVTLAAKSLSLPQNHRAKVAAAFHSPKRHLKRTEFKFFTNGLAASLRSLPRLYASSNDARFNSGPEESLQEQSSSFAEFITSERVKVVAMLALALCNADRVVMSVAIVPLSLANGWSRAFARIVQHADEVFHLGGDFAGFHDTTDFAGWLRRLRDGATANENGAQPSRKRPRPHESVGFWCISLANNTVIMEYKTLELNITSAKDLRDVNSKKMDVYAIVSLSSNYQKIRTFVNKNGGSSPTWNFPVNFTFEQPVDRVIPCRCRRGNRPRPRLALVAHPPNQWRRKILHIRLLPDQRSSL